MVDGFAVCTRILLAGTCETSPSVTEGIIKAFCGSSGLSIKSKPAISTCKTREMRNEISSKEREKKADKHSVGLYGGREERGGDGEEKWNDPMGPARFGT